MQDLHSVMHSVKLDACRHDVMQIVTSIEESRCRLGPGQSISQARTSMSKRVCKIDIEGWGHFCTTAGAVDSKCREVKLTSMAHQL
jgi:hypothetical protein